METRKLQQVGGGTYTVSIPKAWATEHGLEAGLEVHLYAHADGSIVVRSSERDGSALDRASVSVDTDRPKPVARALRAAHAAGFVRVSLQAPTGFTDDQRRTIRAAKRDLVGLEVVDEQPDEITVQNLLAASDVSIRQSLVQLQFVAVSVHRTAAAALLDEEPLDHDRLVERAEEADRLSQLIGRHFARSLVSFAEVDHLGIDRATLFDHHLTAESLGRIADAGVTIARAADGLSQPLPALLDGDLERLTADARHVFDEAATAVLEDADIAAAQAVLDRSDELAAAVSDIDRGTFDDPDGSLELSPRDARAVTRILNGIARTVDHGGRIATVALRGAVQ